MINIKLITHGHKNLLSVFHILPSDFQRNVSEFFAIELGKFYIEEGVDELPPEKKQRTCLPRDGAVIQRQESLRGVGQRREVTNPVGAERTFHSWSIKTSWLS